MKIKNPLFILLIPLLLFGCSNDEGKTINNGQVANIKDLVHEYSVGEFQDQSASIDANQLIITHQDGNKETYDLPKDEFFVSIAPFIQETHDCFIHSLTSCQGELAEKEFDILIKDQKGNVIVDDKMTSLENGFIDLWVPRNEKFDILIEHNGKEIKSQFSTFANDGTCITTMQLM